MDKLKEIIFNLSYEKQNELIDYLNIRNQLINTMVEIHKGYKEPVSFVDYKDIDNGMDYAFRKMRNRTAIDTIIDIIQKDNSTYIEQLKKICNFLNIEYSENLESGSII